MEKLDQTRAFVVSLNQIIAGALFKDLDVVDIVGLLRIVADDYEEKWKSENK